MLAFTQVACMCGLVVIAVQLLWVRTLFCRSIAILL